MKRLVYLSAVLAFVYVGCVVWQTPDPPSPRWESTSVETTSVESTLVETTKPSAPSAPLAPFLEKGLRWLAAAQHESGGWGAGSHANQSQRDPHAVRTDPATTAFAAMTFLRSGHTPRSGEYRDVVKRAVEYIVATVEESPDDGPRITNITGTQPQAKLGPLVDTAMAVQFLSRVLTVLPAEDPFRARVDAALDKALAKLQRSQTGQGTWGGGGWASVLQSSLGCSALEVASAAGKSVDAQALAKAREFQKGNYTPATGRASAATSAGVELYAFAGAQRAAAGEAKAARDIIEKGKTEGLLAPDAAVSTQNLLVAGASSAQARTLNRAFEQSEAQVERLSDEALIRGFGSNGGEEFLSYLLTGESLVITGGDPWEKWQSRMHQRLAAIQNPDGSWTGHHCITSPVFCTSAVVQCLSVDRDAELLRQIGESDVARLSTK